MKLSAAQSALLLRLHLSATEGEAMADPYSMTDRARACGVALLMKGDRNSTVKALADAGLVRTEHVGLRRGGERVVYSFREYLEASSRNVSAEPADRVLVCKGIVLTDAGRAALAVSK